MQECRDQRKIGSRRLPDV